MVTRTSPISVGCGALMLLRVVGADNLASKVPISLLGLKDTDITRIQTII